MRNQYLKKLFPIIIILGVLICVFFYFSLNNLKSNSVKNNNQKNEIISNPEITILVPTSIKPTLNNYNPQYLFYTDEWIYVYQEYYNVTVKNNSYDIHLTINVTKDNILYYFQEVHNSKIENARFWYFHTNQENWLEGRYIITCYLLDNISKKETSSTTYFDLILNPES